MRTFIAIPLPDSIKQQLGTLITELKKSGADVKWVKPDNIHLTLKFLGDQDEKRIKALKEILTSIAQGHARYTMEISRLGGFPTIHNPRVIWVGLAAGDQETKNIATALDNAICKLGIPKEDRPFESHITIGRVRSGLNKEKLASLLSLHEIKAGELRFETSKIILYKSTLTSQGPIYEPLHEVSLK